MAEIYVSTDVETDGPIPGPHSLLSFASAAYLPDKTLVATFAANVATRVLSGWYAADAKLSMECGPGIGPSVSTSVLT